MLLWHEEVSSLKFFTRVCLTREQMGWLTDERDRPELWQISDSKPCPKTHISCPWYADMFDEQSDHIEDIKLYRTLHKL